MHVHTMDIRGLNPAPALQLVYDRLLDSPALSRVSLVVGVAVAASRIVWTLLKTLWEHVVICGGVDHTALIWQAVLCHVAKHVKDVSTIAAITISMVGSTVQQSLAGQHHIWAKAFLGNLQSVLDHVGAAVSPTRPAVYWDVLIPRRCA